MTTTDAATPEATASPRNATGGVAAPPPSGADAAPPTRAPRLGLGSLGVVAAVALGFGAIGGAVGVSLADADSASTVVDVPVAVAGTEDLSGVIAGALPSVVSIEALQSGSPVATGSGFILRADGYLVTNNHVVAASDGNLLVRFEDGTVANGTIVGTTPEYDIAVVKVDRVGLPVLELGDSDAVEVGDQVIAIGAPLGLDSTVTAGIVSALHRPVTAGEDPSAPAFIDAIQTDAAINPGNSGGPLINLQGEVIGINSASAALPGASQSTGAGTVGLGFAIPANQVKRTADEIIATGHATFPVIGVLLDQSYVGEGVKVLDDNPAQGVVGVVAGGPADLAGIRAGDIITAIDGRPVSRPEQLIVATRAKAVGDTVTLTIADGSSSRDVVVTLTANVDVFTPGGDQ